MTKLMDCAGNVFAEGENINEIMEELNKDNGDWEYCYRSSCEVVNAYYCKSGASDYNGEEAEETYDVIEC